MTKTITALIAAALTIGTVGVASAQDGFDPNLGNRYPAFNEPGATQSIAPRAFQQAPVGLRTAPVRLQYQPEFSGQTTTARGDVAPGGDAR